MLRDTNADFNSGYTVSTVTETELLGQIAERTKEAIMVIDSSKFNVYDFVYLGGLDLLPVVISDSNMPEPYKDYYSQHNVKLLISDE
jgi:DeoR/GlpR family transcriptional regulator of sugar metabolism